MDIIHNMFFHRQYGGGSSKEVQSPSEEYSQGRVEVVRMGTSESVEGLQISYFGIITTCKSHQTEEATADMGRVRTMVAIQTCALIVIRQHRRRCENNTNTERGGNDGKGEY